MNKEKVNGVNIFLNLLLYIKFTINNIFKEREVIINKKYVDEKKLSFIAKSLGEIYKDGIAINKALKLVEESISDKSYKKSLRMVSNNINAGKSLSEAFGECMYLYPKLFVGLISIGENTGELYEILMVLGEYYEKSSEMKSQIKTAFIYPFLILFSIVVLILVFINKIIPSFYMIYTSMGITPSYWYKVIYDFQQGFRENYIVNLLCIFCWMCVAFILVRMIISSENFNCVRRFKIVKDITEYKTVLIFNIITNSGISIIQGIDYCIGSITSEYLNRKFIEIKKDILDGNGLSESLKRAGIVSNYTLEVIKIKEETGRISEGFSNLSIRLEKEIHKKIKFYIKALNPILVIIMGIIVFIFISVFVLPLFKDLQSGIR